MSYQTLKKDQIISQQNESLKEAVRNLQETQTMSQDINLQLADQDEKLKKANDLQNDIENELHKSNFLANGISSFWGGFKNIFKKPKANLNKNDKFDNYQPKQKKQSDNNNNQQIIKSKDWEEAVRQQQEFLKQTQTQQEKEQDDLLEEIANCTEQIKYNALLTQQNLDEKMHKEAVLVEKFEKNQKLMNKIDKKQKKIIENN